MGWFIAAVVVLVALALLLPQGRDFVTRHRTTRMCPSCFERYDRKRRSCPVCHTRVDDFGGVAPPPNPLK
jgi:hypothetical protein